MSESKLTLDSPHLDFINKHKIDVSKSEAPSSLKRAITKFDNTVKKWEDLSDDEDLKKMWKNRLEAQSKSILSDLEDLFPGGKAKDLEKEKAEKEAADKAEKEKANKAKSGESEEEKAEKEAAKSKESETGDAEKKAIDIINELWRAKAKDGKLEITEDELSEKGFRCWTYLGFTAGELGGYDFKSALFSETWTITKAKKKEEKKEEVNS